MPDAVLVELPIHLGRAQPFTRGHEHPVKTALGKCGAEFVTSASAYCGSTHESEGHVGAELCGKSVQVVAADMGGPKGVTGDKNCSRVCGPAPHATGDWHVLLNAEMNPTCIASVFCEQLCCLNGEIALVNNKRRSIN